VCQANELNHEVLAFVKTDYIVDTDYFKLALGAGTYLLFLNGAWIQKTNSINIYIYSVSKTYLK